MPSRDLGRSFGWGLAVTLALNAVYFFVLLITAALPPEPVIRNVERSFAVGELGSQDYLRDDWRRGLNQYNDCMVIQLTINRRNSSVEKALAPVAYVSDGTYSDVCATLQHILYPATDTSKLFADRYARYWHGYIPIASALLRMGDIAFARIFLRLFVVVTLLALLLASLFARGPLRAFGVSVSATGLLFWALPYYGQALSYAPGDGVAVVGLVTLIVKRDALRDRHRLIVFCAAYGSLITFFEMLTGQLPTAASLLFVAAYLLGGPAQTVRANWRHAVTAVAAVALGAISTVLIKQVLAWLLLGLDVVEPFFANLAYYAGLSSSARVGMFTPFVHLIYAAHILTYRSIPAGVALLTCTALAWLVAAFAALRSPDPVRRSAFLAYLAGASGVAIWVLLLPTHTVEHAPFMVRILIVPISLGMCALWDSLRHRPAADVPDTTAR